MDPSDEIRYGDPDPMRGEAGGGFSGGPAQVFRRDWFNYIIALFSIVTLILALALTSTTVGNLRTLLRLLRTRPGVGANVGDLVYAGGTIEFEASPYLDATSAELGIWLEKNGSPGFIRARLAWKYSRGSGKSRTTYTERRAEIWRKFALVEGATRWLPWGEPATLISPVDDTIRPVPPELRPHGPQSTWIDLDVFAPKQAWVVGRHAGQGPTGINRVAALGDGDPPMVVGLPRETLLAWWITMVFCQTIAVLAFFTTRFYRFTSDVRDRFARAAGAFYCFDGTGGSEPAAMAMLFVGAIGSGIGLAVASEHVPHGFQRQIVAAVMFAGFVRFLEWCRQLEFLHLWSAADGCLYRFERGFFGVSHEKVVEATRVYPTIDVRTGNKGQKRYLVVQHTDGGGQIELTDAYGSGEKAQEIIEEFQEFRARAMRAGDDRDD